MVIIPTLARTVPITIIGQDPTSAGTTRIEQLDGVDNPTPSLVIQHRKNSGNGGLEFAS